MGIEGRLRDLGLTDVLQLLAAGRKSGTLHCVAPLLGIHLRLGFLQGHIADATLDDTAAGRSRCSSAAEIGVMVQTALRWREGTFRFAPGELPDPRISVRLAVEPLLMEGALQAEVWSRIEARVPHTGVVPTFVEVEPQQLPLLRLSPRQWELLTHVDGQRDLMAIAVIMGSDPSAAAELVHDLIVAGLLMLREAVPAPRRNPTPPVTPAIPAVGELWSNAASDEQATQRAEGDLDDDSVFDPLQWGEQGARDQSAHRTTWPVSRVAPPVPDASMHQRALADETAPQNGAKFQQLGDDCARRGDLASAIRHWMAALNASLPAAEAERVREAMSLATRLHALLQR